jgi:hypothetical protein
MALNIDELKKRAKEYVEIEGKTKVIDVTFAERFILFDIEDVVLSVTTAEKDEPEWWVIGGSTPMNLYAKSRFPSADEAFSMHLGVISRLKTRDLAKSNEPPKEIGYDAFIAHASEDKEAVVRPLANALTKIGFKIWYDEFELKVGDSLRQSIDKGLANSRYAIVILSNAFFSKNWPQYELNGLVAREIDGKKIILPIWHKIRKKDVVEYSPPLADRVALSTNKMSVEEIAHALMKVLPI